LIDQGAILHPFEKVLHLRCMNFDPFDFVIFSPALAHGSFPSIQSTLLCLKAWLQDCLAQDEENVPSEMTANRKK
jgi:hypothetical protein